MITAQLDMTDDNAGFRVPQSMTPQDLGDTLARLVWESFSDFIADGDAEVLLGDLGLTQEDGIPEEAPAEEILIFLMWAHTRGLQLAFVGRSEPVRKQLEIELKLLGAKVQLSESGEQAIELCRENKYDIIFLDVVMPGIDGYEVCKYLKNNHHSKNTPVIMLTGKSSPISKVMGSLSGCDSYLTKPLEREQFQHVAGKYLTSIKQTL